MLHIEVWAILLQHSDRQLPVCALWLCQIMHHPVQKISEQFSWFLLLQLMINWLIDHFEKFTYWLDLADDIFGNFNKVELVAESLNSAS